VSLRKLTTPQQDGRDYETELAARYGGKVQPGSGAGHRFKLDWKLGSLLVSAKRTLHESYRLTAADLREALAGARGPGGRGEVPAMVIKMEGFPDDVWILRGEDVRAIFEGEVELAIEPSKRQSKLAAVRAAMTER
jgi:hypothetical protein